MLMMGRVFGIAAALIFSTAVAQASGTDWQGFYAGINAGGDWAKSDSRTSTIYVPGGYWQTQSPPQIAAAGAFNDSHTGFIGGAQAGFNWQNGNFVFGLEGDVDGTDTKFSNSSGPVNYICCSGHFTVTSNVKSDWQATLRPRIGFASTGWLFYGTGGLAVGNINANWGLTDTNSSAFESASKSETKVGWTLGAGVETMVGRWSVKAEYLYVDLGNESVTSTDLTTAGPTHYPQNVFSHRADLSENIARLGLNYHF